MSDFFPLNRGFHFGSRNACASCDFCRLPCCAGGRPGRPCMRVLPNHIEGRRMFTQFISENPLPATAILAAVSYVLSLFLHPYTKCGTCKGTARHYGALFTWGFRPCHACSGSGRQHAGGPVSYALVCSASRQVASNPALNANPVMPRDEATCLELSAGPPQRARPRVARRSSWSSNHTRWAESRSVPVTTWHRGGRD